MKEEGLGGLELYNEMESHGESCDLHRVFWLMPGRGAEMDVEAR